ncbi:MAG: RluA family pseudouridine synthase [Phycisphaeraceae bacterium]|nr:RluA family pseudouridine synthase [Phycisphaeraceae bacterium]
MAASSQNYVFSVTTEQGGIRLDLFIGEKLGLSRIQARHLLQRRVVIIDGRCVNEKNKGDRLSVGSSVEIESFTPPSDISVIPEPNTPLAIVAQGKDWLIVNKPVEVPVHPLKEGEVGTLLNAVVARYPQIQGVGEAGLRSGVVHRLDIETSGVVLFALRHERWRELRRAFETHTTRKIYRAVVGGKMVGGGTEKVWLYVAQHKPARVRVSTDGTIDQPPGSRECDLQWKALNSSEDTTHVEISLGTGFLHQIRVMFASMGHPVIGDLVYGGTAAPHSRLMLHAFSLAVGDIFGEAPLPKEFEFR